MSSVRSAFHVERSLDLSARAGLLTLCAALLIVGLWSGPILAAELAADGSLVHDLGRLHPLKHDVSPPLRDLATLRIPNDPLDAVQLRAVLERTNLWASFGGACEAIAFSSPAILFDATAQRWIIGKSVENLHCVAVSLSPDATGPYDRYSFDGRDRLPFAILACGAACQSEFLTEHNRVRTRLNNGQMPSPTGFQPTPAPPLAMLQWDAGIAAAAQTWADGCVFGHDPGNPLGENIFAGTPGFFTPTDAVGNWESETTRYTYAVIGDPINCGSPTTQCTAAGAPCACCTGAGTGDCATGHYTQLVWANTTLVGCGLASCPPTMDFMVCRYSPAGNVTGQFPYVAAIACTTNADCPADTNVCTTAVCQNPGTPQAACVQTNNTAACDDGNVCTSNDVCAAGVCAGTNNTAACTDGNACTDPDVCANGACVPGANVCACTTNADCPADTNVCTTAVCQNPGTPQAACVQTNNTAACDDANVCTSNDVCAGGVCAGTNNTATCTDGNACTDPDVCANGACVPGGNVCACTTNADCPADTNVCTTAVCQNPGTPQAACVQTNNTAACDDGNVCTSNDVCAGGVCAGTNNTATCTDGNACTDPDVCANGACVPGGNVCACTTNADCPADTNVCTTAVCQNPGTPQAACVQTNNTAACDDGNVCTSNDVCAGGVCAGTNNTAACTDGNACTDPDVCANGACVPGANVCACTTDGDCPADTNACTTAVCQNPGTPQAACVQTNNTAACDDGNGCTSNDVCAAGVCAGTNNTAACTDGNPCTDPDVCAGGACVPGGNVCACTTNADCPADTNVCTTAVCQNPGTPQAACVQTNNTAACDDGNVCTSNDVCAAGVCAGTNNTAACSDGNACTDPDVCAGGACVPGGNVCACATDGDCPADTNVCTTAVCQNPGTPQAACVQTNNTAACDDGNVCTSNDVCAAGVCAGANNTAACTDGNACTDPDVCAGGACVPGANVCACATDGDCPADTNVCTTAVCQNPGTPQAACVQTNNTAACDDGNGCTSNDVCAAGVCAGTNNTAACTDGNACTDPDVCANGACVPGANVCACTTNADCPADTNVCTTAVCQNPGTPQAACVQTNNTAACDDGNVCTSNDVCAAGVCAGTNNTAACTDGNACTDPDVCANGACVPGANVCACTTNADCPADTNVCTTAVCQNPGTPQAACVQTNNTAACDDGNVCTSNDVCAGGVCAGTNNTAACTDGNACTDPDVCAGGACVPGANVCACATDGDCPADTNVCTTAVCQNPGTPQAACVQTNNTAACDDGNVCTSNDVCAAGVCAGTNNTAACSDGNACTDPDVCAGGACVPGGNVCACATDGDCPADTNVCTTAVCQNPGTPQAACVQTNNTAACDDGNVCTSNDVCAGGVCAGANNTAACTDGNPCTDPDVCAGGACVPGGNVCACATDGDCPADTNVCTTAVCQNPGTPQATCVQTNNTATCDDGNVCTSNDVCAGGVCAGANNTAACTDGNACTDPDVCAGGACVPGGNVCACATDGDCPADTNVCTTAVCQNPGTPQATCVQTNNTATCDDGNVCTSNDVCAGGVCAGTNNTAACTDGNACTDPDVCAGGACVPGANVCACATDGDCPADTNVCTTAVCQNPGTPQAACVQTNNTAACDDGNVCTSNDVCAGGVCAGANNTAACTDGNACTDPDVCAGGACVPGGNVCACATDGDCPADTNVCTTAVCQNPGTPQAACVQTNNTAACDDGNVCTSNDVCAGGVCAGANNTAACTDGNACTDPDVCAGGACVPGANVCACATDGDCPADTNVCTTAVCQNPGTPQAACVQTNNTAACDDGNVCTSNDVCAGGVCAGTNNTAACTDGNACTDPDVCAGGACVPGGNVCACATDGDCPADTNVCTTAVCQNPGTPQAACVQTNNTAACDDGNVCTSNDVCAAGVCAGTNNTAACTDGNPCTDPDVCAGGACVPGANVCACATDGDCPADTNVCTTAVCQNPGTPQAACVQTNNTAACDDANVCTSNDVCAGGVCAGTNNTATCTDGNACTDPDVCANGACVPGGNVCACTTNADCPADTNVCTTAVCQNPGTPQAACVQTNNTAACDDGNVCTSNDVCAAGVCAGTNNTAACTDGNACTDPDVCANGACVPGANVCACTTDGDCPADTNVCTTAVCQNPGTPQAACVQTNNTAACDDGNVCTSNDVCAAGVCAGTNNTAACTDGNACTDPDVCANGACVPGANVCACTTNADCPADTNVCTTAVCQNPGTPQATCVQTNNTATCDDGNVCTSNDVCAGGVCAGANNTAACTDGNACTDPDVCAGGACVPGANVCACATDGDCPADTNVCTTAVCQNPGTPQAACVQTNNTAACDDGNVCTSNDVCAGGVCAGTNNTAACTDGNACTDPDVCAGGACVPGGNVCACATDGDCPADTNVCTTAVCQNPGTPQAACVQTNNTAACDDGNVCTSNDVCAAGVCAGTNNTAACTDGNPCTDPDVCAGGACVPGGNVCACATDGDCPADTNVCTTAVCQNPGTPQAACVQTNNTAACDDGNVCTSNDVCAGGVCAGTNNTAACTDGNACTDPDVCAGGACVPGGNVCTTVLFLNEIHYDQASGEQEFIELFAPSVPVDLTGWTISDQDEVTYVIGRPNNPSFPCTGTFTLNAGDRLLISQGAGTNVCTGTSRKIFLNRGTFLQKDGDDVVLRNGGGICQDYVAFETGTSVNPPPAGCNWTGPNPNNGNVAGVSISRFDVPLVDTDTGADWERSGASTTTGPKSPGVVNIAPPACFADADCNDGNPCTDGTCQNPGVAGAVCVQTNNTAACDDGNACTTQDACSGGTCVGGANTCPGVFLNEVHYDQAAGEQEFVELLATGGPINLTGWTLSDQDELNYVIGRPANPSFPCTGTFTLNAGDRVVIWQGAGTSVCTGSVRQIFLNRGTFLQSAGDDLVLRNAGGVCQDYVAFENGASVNPVPAGCAWAGPNPNNGNTLGRSISRFDVPFTDTNRGADWERSGTTTTTGPKSPGALNVSTFVQCSSAADCSDGNPCTDAVCQNPGTPQSLCVQSNNTAACDDGNACTNQDTCSNGACVGGPSTCPEVHLTEVHYDQSSSEQEFIELLATGGAVNLTGWTISDQDEVTYVLGRPANPSFPCVGTFTLNAGDRLTIFQGAGTNVCTGTSRKIFLNRGTFLQSAGDDLVLRNNSGVCQDYVAFETGASVNPVPAGCAWTGPNPSNGNTVGRSISRFDNPLVDTNRGADWERSGTTTTTSPKTPGTRNVP